MALANLGKAGVVRQWLVRIVAQILANAKTIRRGLHKLALTATVRSIDPDALMDQAGSDYIRAGRVLHAGSIIMTHAVVDQIHSSAVDLLGSTGMDRSSTLQALEEAAGRAS